MEAHPEVMEAHNVGIENHNWNVEGLYSVGQWLQIRRHFDEELHSDPDLHQRDESIVIQYPFVHNTSAIT